MDTTDNILETAGEPQMVITADAKYYLQKAGRWASFIGIVGFVMSGLVAVLALFIGSIFAAMARINPMMALMSAGMGTLMTVIYLFVALFSFFFALYVYQFGSRIKKAVVFNDSEGATLAFSKLKSFFKLWGITTIVVISFYVLAIAFGILGVMASLAGAH
ncbi:DUF5362 family protein [Mucilaginibacter sp.]|uniref:DUF5362 family protein n=1 Tax=Mucilaginibacter sp. TaxID=1882438 RepID=UPI00326502DA